MTQTIKTANYISYIRGNDISRSPIVKHPAGQTLTQAKRYATLQHGGGYIDHTIVLAILSPGGFENQVIALKNMRGAWRNAE